MFKEKLLDKYRSAKNKLILLDYDGTLSHFTAFPEKARPTPQLLTILSKLIHKSHTKVIIISGREHFDIQKILGQLPVDMVAGHGEISRVNGVWTEQFVNHASWKNILRSFMNRITLSCPNSFIEEKQNSLTWHYRNVSSGSGYYYSRKLIRLMEPVIHSFNLKILDGNKVVEVMPNEIGKGKAVKKIIEQNDYDFILSIGDDKTDEEMFEVLLLNPDAITIKVGKGSTFAKHKLNNVDEVLVLLEQLVYN